VDIVFFCHDPATSDLYTLSLHDALPIYWKQVRWLAIGFALMFALSRIDYHVILDQALILYLLSIAALVAVLVVGHTRFGAKRWIIIPGLGELLQVSELVKLVIIIVLARFFAEVRRSEERRVG